MEFFRDGHYMGVGDRKYFTLKLKERERVSGYFRPFLGKKNLTWAPYSMRQNGFREMFRFRKDIRGKCVFA